MRELLFALMRSGLVLIVIMLAWRWLKSRRRVPALPTEAPEPPRGIDFNNPEGEAVAQPDQSPKLGERVRERVKKLGLALHGPAVIRPTTTTQHLFAPEHRARGRRYELDKLRDRILAEHVETISED
jgi:hypothetical protein